MRSGLVLLLGAWATTCQAGVPVNDWCLSDSDTDFHPVSTPWVGERTLFLWTMTVPPLPLDHAELGVGGTLQIVSFTPRAPWSNAGTATDLILQRASCVTPSAEVVGELVVRDTDGTGGRVCFQNASTGFLCSRTCKSSRGWLAISHHGFASDAQPVCEGYGHEDCLTVAVDPTSWGRTKATYR